MSLPGIPGRRPPRRPAIPALCATLWYAVSYAAPLHAAVPHAAVRHAAEPHSAAAAGSALATSMPAKIGEVLAAQGLPPAAVSFVILDPDNGRVLLSHLPDVARSPASTIKTVTSFAALDLLGPAFTWHTRAAITGDLKDGVLEGDLILRGGGDPYITLERWWSFARSLRTQGLKSIRGDIVIDDTAFSLPDEDPAAFDGKPNRSYNVLPNALMVNFQSVEFRVSANRQTRHVDIVATPAPVNLLVENDVRFVAGRCVGSAARVDFQVASEQWDRVVFSGALSPDCAERQISRVLLKPASYAFGSFVELWRELGGEFGGKMRIAATPADARPFSSFDSLTLGEIIRLTNKFSSNLMARHLLLTLGAERFGPPATLQKGADALAEWGRERGIDLSAVDIDNGSGLSRSTHIPVLTMARILSLALHSRFAPEFLASLPLAGIDGTLRSRMKSVPAGAVRLKTGHLDGVSGVAGYVTVQSGKTYVLVSLVNDARADFGGAEPLHAALVTWMLENL
jgi:D-alanyl-D-alanine carboxypeptidase/D-alanyl-D-alanine-endopeptidase (penicillin-binding protein 4)